jgi:hypothetical protein
MIPEEVISELRDLNEKVPRPLRLPSEAEIDQVERQLGVQFHPDFRQYLLTLSDVTFSVFEPVTITHPESHTHLPTVANRAWSMWNVPKTLIPICMDNADFYCVHGDGSVLFWSHDMQAPSGETWPSVGDWIKDVWIAEGKDLQQ